MKIKIDIKKALNYRKQNNNYENRNIKCEYCINFFAVSPYKNRCDVIGTDLKDKKQSIQLDGICDKFETK